MQYNVLEGMEADLNDFSQELYLTYYNYTSKNRRVNLRVRSFEKLPTVEFEVFLDSIPDDQPG